MKDQTSYGEHGTGQVGWYEKPCYRDVDDDPDCYACEHAYPEGLASIGESEYFDLCCYADKDCSGDEPHDEMNRPAADDRCIAETEFLCDRDIEYFLTHSSRGEFCEESEYD